VPYCLMSALRKKRKKEGERDEVLCEPECQAANHVLQQMITWAPTLEHFTYTT